MKATGIVRRIDDLGRVVVPKEIRRTMRIREGEPLEIFTDAGGSVIFRKYSPAGEQGGLALNLCEAVFKATGKSVAICDRDSVIAVAGSNKKELENKPFTAEIDSVMQSRQLQQFDSGITISAVSPDVKAELIAPIISGGDLNGCVMLLHTGEHISDSEVKIAQVAASVFAKQLED